jgi:phospholipid/cholesterol/gamma-HCH transport system substrate-binding protein
MTESLRRGQAILLGLVVVVALVLIGGGLFAVGDHHQLWHGSYHVSVTLPSAGGLDVGSRVRVQGVNAGQVVALEQPAVRGGAIVVRLRLDGRFRTQLGADARADVKNEGLLGSKVVDLHPGSPGADLLAEHAIIPGRVENLTDDLQKLAEETEKALQDVRALAGKLATLSVRSEKAVGELEGLTRDLREGEGPLGKEVLAALKQVRESSQTVNNSFGALKHLPLVGKHIDEHVKLLVRPGSDKAVMVFSETELFHEGRSVFHPEGVERLKIWASANLPKTKLKGSEVVIVAYTDPNHPDPRAAELLTQEQAEAVKTYLTDHHEVHKVSFWSKRPVTAVGLGTKPAPGLPISPPPPLRRIEIIVFAPAGTLS